MSINIKQHYRSAASHFIANYLNQNLISVVCW